MGAWVAVLRRLQERDRTVASCCCRAARLAAHSIALLDASGGLETLPVIVNASPEDAGRLRNSIVYTAASFVGGGRELPLRDTGGCAAVCRGSCDLNTCLCGMGPGGEPSFLPGGRLRQRATHGGSTGDSGAAADFPQTECGPACACAASCPNRVTQQPVSVPLTLVPAGECGWGVVTETRLPAGQFVAIYAGEARCQSSSFLRGVRFTVLQISAF